MSAPYNALSQFPGTGQYAVKRFMGGYMAQPIVVPLEPWWRPGDLTHVIPSAKLETFVNVPIHKPGMQKWAGSWVFDDQSNLFMSVKRDIYTKGSKANMIRLAEMDFGAWSMSPQTMAVEVGNNPGIELVALLNAAFTANDQVYKGSTIAKLNSGTLKQVNPADPTVGSGWYNAHENFSITAPNIVTAIKNMQQRKAHNGIELGLGSEGLEVWVPYLNLEETRLLLEVFRELASSGILAADLKTYVVDVGGADQINQQVVFGTQTNPVFGRAKVRAIHGMRTDMWALVSPPPPNLRNRPEVGLFLYAHGGQVGQYSVMTDPNALTTDTVPHIALFEFAQQSAMFFGVPGVSNAGDVGVAAIVNEGFAWASGLLAEFCYTGSAS